MTSVSVSSFLGFAAPVPRLSSSLCRLLWSVFWRIQAKRSCQFSHQAFQRDIRPVVFRSSAIAASCAASSTCTATLYNNYTHGYANSVPTPCAFQGCDDNAIRCTCHFQAAPFFRIMGMRASPVFLSASCAVRGWRPWGKLLGVVLERSFVLCVAT